MGSPNNESFIQEIKALDLERAEGLKRIKKELGIVRPIHPRRDSFVPNEILEFEKQIEVKFKAIIKKYSD